ncbi:MAG: hypothetical protein BMS9Abin23_0941 [Thermodesulfobacteriota bacterium]|nr:MAG: hypothetical protein BMS9Abin23_0941 [Thermodesulfobacteriota bacterium]
MEKTIKTTLLAPLTLMAVLMTLIHLTTAPAGAAGMEYSLQVTVDVSPELKGNTTPDQVVFIFAKALRGPRAPLAAIRAQVRDLPMTVTLDDSMAMAPVFKMSKFKDVKISARVSKSGGAMKRSGDLEGVIPHVKLEKHNKPVTVVIDHVVP